MANGAMHTYLNDHLAGAMLGSNLAKQIRRRTAGTPLGDLMGPLARDIEDDRRTLIGLMERMGTAKSPLKQIVAWVAERTSRAKLGRLRGGASGTGLFLSLETLALGVEGKLSLWIALRAVAGEHQALDPAQLGRLIERARAQRQLLERERMAVALRVLQGDQPSE